MATENLFSQQLMTGEKVSLQNVGIGSSIVARRDEQGFALRTLRSGAGIQISVVNDDIVISNSGSLQQSFLSLAEAPDDFTGANGKYLAYNSVTGLMEFSTPSPQYGSVLNLTDTPSSYTGKDGQYLVVDATNNRMVFSDLVGTRITPLESRATAIEASIVALQNKKLVTVNPNAPANPNQGEFWFDAEDGALYIAYGNPAAWVEVGSAEPAAPPANTYDYAGSFEATPTAGQVLFRRRSPIAHVLKDEFAGCTFTCEGAPSATFSCKVYVNGTHVGDWHISASRNYTLITLATEVVVPPNAEVKVVAPAVAVTGITGITMTFFGERQ